MRAVALMIPLLHMIIQFISSFPKIKSYCPIQLKLEENQNKLYKNHTKMSQKNLSTIEDQDTIELDFSISDITDLEEESELIDALARELREESRCLPSDTQDNDPQDATYESHESNRTQHQDATYESHRSNQTHAQDATYESHESDETNNTQQIRQDYIRLASKGIAFVEKIESSTNGLMIHAKLRRGGGDATYTFSKSELFAANNWTSAVMAYFQRNPETNDETREFRELCRSILLSRP